MKYTALEQIQQTGIISILRGVEETCFKETIDTLYDAGIRCVEITLNTPGALKMIETAKELFGDRMAIGAGTVLEEVSARCAILSGADFVLSPTLSTNVIEMCCMYNCLAIPGAFTPTEALEAWKAGAGIVKIFPCGSVGPSYIKDLRGPLPQIKMMPVGGVNLNNAESFFAAGSFVLGVGSSLFDPKLAKAGCFSEIHQRAREFISISTKFRT